MFMSTYTTETNFILLRADDSPTILTLQKDFTIMMDCFMQ